MVLSNSLYFVIETHLSVLIWVIFMQCARTAIHAYRVEICFGCMPLHAYTCGFSIVDGFWN